MTGQSLWANRSVFNLATSVRKTLISICRATLVSFTLATVLSSCCIHAFLLALALIELARFRSRISFFFNWSSTVLFLFSFLELFNSSFRKLLLDFWLCESVPFVSVCFNFCIILYKNINFPKGDNYFNQIYSKLYSEIPFLLAIASKLLVSWTPISRYIAKEVPFLWQQFVVSTIAHSSYQQNRKPELPTIASISHRPFLATVVPPRR